MIYELYHLFIIVFIRMVFYANVFNVIINENIFFFDWSACFFKD